MSGRRFSAGSNSVLEKATGTATGAVTARRHEILSEAEYLAKLNPPTTGLIIVRDERPMDQQQPAPHSRRRSSQVKTPTPSGGWLEPAPPPEKKRRSTIMEGFRAIIARLRRRKRPSVNVQKKTNLRGHRQPLRQRRGSQAEEFLLRTSDLDIVYGRSNLEGGASIDIEWWWLSIAAGRHRLIVIFLALLITIAIAHIIAAVIMFSTEGPVPDPYLCETTGCEVIRDNILRTLNKSVNPCNDFHQFVCGGIRKTEDESWSLNDDAIVFNVEHSTTIGKMLRSKRTFPYNQLLPFYRACMDKRYRDKAGLEPFINLLKKYNLIEFDEALNGHSFEKILSDLYKDNVMSARLFAFELEFMDKEFEILQSIHSGLLRPLKAGLRAYKRGMKVLLDHLYEELELAPLSDDTLDLIICTEFILFHDSSETPWESDKSIIGNCDYTKLQTSGPPLTLDPWQFMSNLFGDRIPDLAVWSIKVGHSGHSGSNKYLGVMIDLFNKIDYTFVLRFLQWEALKEYASELDSVSASKSCVITRHNAKCTRVASCTWTMFKVMPFIASVGFLDAMEKMDKFNSDLEFLLATIRESVANVTKASRQQRNRILGSFSRVVEDAFRQVKIVYPIGLAEKYTNLNTTDIPLFFNGLSMKKDHVENILTIRRIEGLSKVEAHLQFLEDSIWVNRPKYHIDVLSKNIRKKLLTVPVGSLTPPFFQSTFPALDLSANGFVVAQALARFVFTDYFLRLQYSRVYGKSFEGMTHADILRLVLLPYQKLLQESAKSLRTSPRPDRWIFDGTKFDPQDAVPYNMYVNQLADQFALKVAYTAHEKYLKARPRYAKQILKGLEDLSPRKIFFMSLASFRCTTYPPDKLEYMKTFGPIPSSLSLNLMAANSKEFSEAFQCPFGSAPMNPELKINLYDD